MENTDVLRARKWNRDLRERSEKIAETFERAVLLLMDEPELYDDRNVMDVLRRTVSLLTAVERMFEGSGYGLHDPEALARLRMDVQAELEAMS